MPHKLDVWLPRLAYIAQVVLLGLTASAFFLTVLPLYQKALLDEALARKEIELKQVTATLDAKYAQLRRVAVRDFVLIADADCSGFTTMIRKALDRSYTEQTTFAIDVKKCLFDHEQKAPSLSELRSSDRTFFRATLATAADRIVKLQSDAAASYAHAETDINASNIDAYANKGEFSAELMSILSRQVTPKDFAQYKHKQAIEALREERVSAYQRAVTIQLRKLITMQWPTHQQIDATINK